MRLKHGVEAAGTGRGRGGGLERVGVKGVGGRKGRKGVVRAGGGVGGGRGVENGAAGDEYMSAMPTVHQQQLPPPPSTSETTPVDFEVNNFTPNPTACRCGARFENREAVLAHLHTAHNEPPSAQCNCMLCLGTFGGDVDAAGVHVREKGAVRSRGLMADDLFGGDGEQDGSATAGAMDDWGGTAVVPPVANANKGVDADPATAQALAAVGMTVEQFTANMPRQVQSSAAKVNAVDQGIPAVSAAEIEDLAAWLESAEDVCGDDGGYGKLSILDEMDIA